MTVHLLVMPMGQVQRALGQELRPALDRTTARRPGHHLDLGLGPTGKDRCSRQRQLVWAEPGLVRCLVLSPPGTKMVAQDVRDSARQPLDLAVLEQDGLGVLELEVTPDNELDREAFYDNKLEMNRFVMYMQGEGESSESLESLPRGIHDPGSGRLTPGMCAPAQREPVLAEDAWLGPCVHHRATATGSSPPKLKAVLTLNVSLRKTSRVPRQAHGVHVDTLVRSRRPHRPRNATEADTGSSGPEPDGRAPTGAPPLISGCRGTRGRGLFLGM